MGQERKQGLEVGGQGSGKSSVVAGFRFARQLACKGGCDYAREFEDY